MKHVISHLSSTVSLLIVMFAIVVNSSRNAASSRYNHVSAKQERVNDHHSVLEFIALSIEVLLDLTAEHAD